MTKPERSFFGELADGLGLGKEWDEVTTEIQDGVAEMKSDFREARDTVKTATADGIVGLDKFTGLEKVSDANTATAIGIKAGLARGIWGGPVVAAKAAFISGVTARLLVTSNVKDVRNWAKENCTKPPANDGGVA